MQWHIHLHQVSGRRCLHDMKQCCVGGVDMKTNEIHVSSEHGYHVC
jgi:hypothetical protein